MGSPFGSFTLLEELGRGADSVVYRASHPGLGRDLALKIFTAADDSMAVAAVKVGGIANRAIVPAYEAGVTDDHAWVAMRCITGVDLHTWLQHTRPELSDVISVVRQVASALDAMHSAGMAHGDVKPSNILLTTGAGRPDRMRAYLVDPIPADSIRMTLDYAAPERIRGEAASPGADQYALATVAYQCLAGTVPYPASTVTEAVDAHLRDSATSLSLLGRFSADLACALDVVLGSALALRPADRFASCGALAAAMDRAEHAASPPAYPPPFPGWTAPPYGEQPQRFDNFRPDTPTDYGPAGGYGAGAPPAPTGARLGPAPAAARRPDWGMLTCESLPVDEDTILAAIRDSTPAVVERAADNDATDDVVDCSVFAAPKVVPGSTTLVQVFVHLPDQASQAAAEAAEFDEDAVRRGVRTLEAPIARGEKLVFDLTMPGLEVVEPVRSLVWTGRPAAVQFAVDVPGDLRPPRTSVGTVGVSRDGVTLGTLLFKMQVVEQADESGWRMAGDDATRFTRAFVSYSSADRAAVLARVQVLRAARIDYFQDIDMEPGERWEKQLYRQIDGCDLFLLFWSQAAKDSEWVKREVDYALGLGAKCPQIRPVVIEGPPVPPPWDELKQLHFDDRLLSLLATASR